MPMMIQSQESKKEQVHNTSQEFSPAIKMNLTITQIPDLLSKYTAITAIHLIAVPDIVDEHVIGLAEKLLGNKTLRVLDLHGNKLTDASAPALAQLLESNAALVSLDLASNNFGPKTANPLGKAIAANKTLEWLSVFGNPIREGIAELVSFIGRNTGLKSLDLGGIDMRGAGVDSVIEMIENNVGPARLSLAQCNLGSGSCSAIAEALTNNSKLTYLNLANNKLGVGVCELADGLRQATNLTQVGLENNDLDYNCVFVLYLAMMAGDRDIVLHLKENGLDHLKEIAKAFEKYRAAESIVAAANPNDEFYHSLTESLEETLSEFTALQSKYTIYTSGNDSGLDNKAVDSD